MSAAARSAAALVYDKLTPNCHLSQPIYCYCLLLLKMLALAAKNDFKNYREYWIPRTEANRELNFGIMQDLIEQGWLVLRFEILKSKKMLQRVQIKPSRHIEIELKSEIQFWNLN